MLQSTHRRLCVAVSLLQAHQAAMPQSRNAEFQCLTWRLLMQAECDRQALQWVPKPTPAVCCCREELHLDLLAEVLGAMPSNMTTHGAYASKYFDASGCLKAQAAIDAARPSGLDKLDTLLTMLAQHKYHGKKVSVFPFKTAHPQDRQSAFA